LLEVEVGVDILVEVVLVVEVEVVDTEHQLYQF
jgi:hypothetical protein